MGKRQTRSSWLTQRIEPDLNLQLKQVAKTHGITKSTLSRDAIFRHLKELEMQNPAV